MSELSFRKNPRPGQAEVIRTAMETGRNKLCAKLPTGYGKTFTAAAVYSSLQHEGRVNRLLYLVPTVSQLDQFVQDGKSDLEDACVDGPLYICDIRFCGAAVALKQHRQNSHQVFAATIQGLSSQGLNSTVKSLMENGSWMICVDEYHHYGADKTWGRTVLDLQRMPSCKYLLAMSATPNRPDDDGAFGKPDKSVTYRQAVKEGCVKPLKCHSYTYRVDALEEDGDVKSYTMDEIYEMAGGTEEHKVQKIFKLMRFLPKYISPLVDIPLSRMIRERSVSGPLQALIGASCCSHAKLVCDQAQAMFPELRIDWVGTGKDGRSEGENQSVLKKFCPPKVNGRRDPMDIKLDVLVHVGMAGEGLDTVYVSEVIHLNPANKNNSNDQENGRAARFLPGVTGYINVETGSDYARKYLGSKVELAFDSENPTDDEPREDDPNERNSDIKPLPEEPFIYIKDIECIEVNTGEVLRMKDAVRESYESFGSPVPSDEILQKQAEKFYKSMKMKEAEAFNDRGCIEQWDQSVKTAMSVVTRRVVRLMCPPPTRPSKDLYGDVKKRINSRKKRSIGPVEKDVAILKKHWQWLQKLDTELINANGVPTWLA
jgi:hypothetical protein